MKSKMQKTPLILVPSLWVTSRSYRVLGKLLETYFTVYVPDLYRGETTCPKIAVSIEDYVDALDAFIRDKKFKAYYLVGISFSGVVVTKYVLRGLRLPKKLFLISTTVIQPPILHQWRTLVVGYIKLLYHNLFSREGLAKNWLWITDGAANALHHLRQVVSDGIITSSLRIEPIAKMPVPTKLLFALQDEFIPRSVLPNMAPIKNLSVETVDGYHGWFFGHEEELVRRMRAFLCYN